MLSLQTSWQSTSLPTGSPFGEESERAKINMLWFLPILIHQLESDISSDKQILVFNLICSDTCSGATKLLCTIASLTDCGLVTCLWVTFDFYLVLLKIMKISNPSLYKDIVVADNEPVTLWLIWGHRRIETDSIDQ